MSRSVGAMVITAAVVAGCGSGDGGIADEPAATVPAAGTGDDGTSPSVEPASTAPNSSDPGVTAGSGDPAGSGDAFTAIDNGPITHWQHQSDARAAIVEGLVGDYASAGGASVEFESIPYSDYFVRLGAALEAGSGPCVMQIPANILTEFQARGQLAPVPDDVMTAAEIESTFTAASISLLDVDDQYYALPTDVQTMMLFYNDDLFEAAGLDPTKDFATWEEFRAAAIALTTSDGDQMTQAGLDITSSPYQWYYSSPTLAYEDGLVSDDTHQAQYASEPGYQVWERLTGLVTTDGVDSTEFLSEQSKFGSGLAGMVLKEYTFDGVYKLTAPDVNFSVHLPPPVADEQFAPVASTSWAYAVSADCENQEGAWNWIQYLTSEDAQRTWIAEGGELPSRVALLDDPTLAADPAVAAGFSALAQAVPYDSLGWDDAFAVQQDIWDQIVVGGTDVHSAVDAGAEAENELYATKGVGR
ncbi:MAG: extracellular solute-binding protein [Ilumatobacteraceae bacterium]